MINLNKYIVEKLRINDDTKLIDNNPKPNTSGGDKICEKISNLNIKIDLHQGGYLYNKKVKMLSDGKHFLIRPDDIGDDEKIHNESKAYNISFFLLDELKKVNLQNLYIIEGYRTSKGVKLHYFFIGENGELFNDKIEAKNIINKRRSMFSPWNSKLGKSNSLSYKHITIEEALKIKADWENHLDYNIRFY